MRSVSYKREKAYCNFTVQAIRIEDIVDDGIGEPIPSVVVRLKFREGENEKQEEYVVLLSDLDDFRWQDLDVRCCYEGDVAASKVNRGLSNLVRGELDKLPRRRVCRFTRAGMYEIEGKPVYCTGKEVIQSSLAALNIAVIANPMRDKLDINEGLAENDAIAAMHAYSRLSPKSGVVMLAYKLGFIMRIAYIAIGKNPKSCILLYGKSGSQKTTFASHLLQSYNRSQGIVSPPRLSSSVSAAVQMLLDSSNDVIILDDFCPTDSGRIRDQMELTLIEIIRYVGDGIIPAKMSGKKLIKEYPQCGVIFTSEQIWGNGSDAARILSVEMEKPDLDKLSRFQENPTIISTFYYYYISWFIENYDEIVELLRKIWAYHGKNNLGIHDKIWETYLFLSSAYYFFLLYCYQKDFMSDLEATQYYHSFCELLTKLVQKQNDRVEGSQSEAINLVDYLQRIRMLYNTGQMSIARDTETFDKEQHDGLLHRNRLYLRGDRVSAYFPESTMKDIADSLDAQGVLEVGKKSRTKQISGLNGMRFYVILPNYLI